MPGTHPQAARFLADHDVRYVVWSIRESKDLAAWQSIMQSIDADYRWMEFSGTPDAHVGLWIRRYGERGNENIVPTWWPRWPTG